ncbi:hypothetical protein FRB97_007165, partial [Tulasnella sp. 331]
DVQQAMLYIFADSATVTSVLVAMGLGPLQDIDTTIKDPASLFNESGDRFRSELEVSGPLFMHPRVYIEKSVVYPVPPIRQDPGFEEAYQVDETQGICELE